MVHFILSPASSSSARFFSLTQFGLGAEAVKYSYRRFHIVIFVRGEETVAARDFRLFFSSFAGFHLLRSVRGENRRAEQMPRRKRTPTFVVFRFRPSGMPPEARIYANFHLIIRSKH